MMARLRLAGLLPFLLLLGACATAPSARAPAVPAAEAERQQAQRREALEALPAWSLQGRVAITSGQKGGSGRLEWSQQDGDYRVSLSAPVTRQSWSLAAHPDGGAVLEGVEGGPRHGADASLLLREATGWEIPVQELAWWVRGLETPGAAGVEYGPDGRLQRMRASGWDIEYQEWLPPQDGFPAMPRRLQAERGSARVRLVVDGWSAP
jgi:outer membrane lipoprotein LolB